MSMNSLYIIELLTYISRIIIKIYFHKNNFPLAYSLYCVNKYTSTGVAEIEMIPI